MIHVLSLNNDPLVTTTLRLIFATTDDIHIVAELSDPNQLAGYTSELIPDVLVMGGPNSLQSVIVESRLPTSLNILLLINSPDELPCILW